MYLSIYDILSARDAIEPRKKFNFPFGDGNGLCKSIKLGDEMVTYQDLFLFCTFIIALISLLYQIFNDKRK